MIYAPPDEPEPELVVEAEAQPETAALEWPGGTFVIEQRVTVIGRSSEADVRLDDAKLGVGVGDLGHITLRDVDDVRRTVVIDVEGIVGPIVRNARVDLGTSAVSG